MYCGPSCACRYKTQVTGHKSLFYQYRKYPKHPLKLTLGQLRPNVSICKRLGLFLFGKTMTCDLELVTCDLHFVPVCHVVRYVLGHEWVQNLVHILQDMANMCNKNLENVRVKQLA